MYVFSVSAIERLLTNITGPFELTKQAAQISVLMAKSNTSSMDDPIRQSYAQKGTFRTAKNIVMNRGFAGLYSGFNLHLREYNHLAYANHHCKTYLIHTGVNSERHHWHGDLLLDLREHQATPCEAPWQRFTNIPSVRGYSRWSLWSGFMGLRKYPPAPEANVLIMLTKMPDLPNRHGKDALSAQLPLEGQGPASEHAEDPILQSQDVSR